MIILKLILFFCFFVYMYFFVGECEREIQKKKSYFKKKYVCIIKRIIKKKRIKKKV